MTKEAISAWITARCIVGMHSRASAASLLADFREWERAEAPWLTYQISGKAFGIHLRDMGFYARKSSGRMFYLGIALAVQPIVERKWAA